MSIFHYFNLIKSGTLHACLQFIVYVMYKNIKIHLIARTQNSYNRQSQGQESDDDHFKITSNRNHKVISICAIVLCSIVVKL